MTGAARPRDSRARLGVAAITGALLLAVALTSCESGAPPGPPSPAPGAGLGPSEYERAVLADGLTFAEYERAFFDYVGCAERAGWALVDTPRLTTRREYVFQFVLHAEPDESEEELDRSFAGREQCRKEHFNLIQAEWARLVGLTQQEKIEARRFLAACIHEHGYPEFPENPPPDAWGRFIGLGPDGPEQTITEDLIKRIEVGRTCAERTQHEFGLRPGEVP